MKIVNIIGGLGNQMFQYAMYIALKETHPKEEVLLCRKSYKGYPLHNGYELDRIFGIEAPEATIGQLMKVAYPFFNYRTWQIMRHWLPVRKKTMTRGSVKIPFDYSQITRSDSVYYDGYWQNEKNFISIRDVLLDTFLFPPFTDSQNEKLAGVLQNSNVVACHIRRGDYVKESNMCVCTPSYYAHAIIRMNDMVNPQMYCIFSDDMIWCRDNITPLIGNDKKIVFVDWNKGENCYRDMQLMSLCKHNIIANSSFSWWGAWLNQNTDKVVMAPSKWMVADIVNDPICKSWIRINF